MGELILNCFLLTSENRVDSGIATAVTRVSDTMDSKIIITERESFIERHNEIIQDNRRNLLKVATGVLAGSAAFGIFGLNPALAKQAVTKERELTIFTPALGEITRTVYWTPSDGYIRESLDELSWALRDRRTTTAKLYDPHVLDQLFSITLRLGYGKPVHGLSGYRSPQTNAQVRGAKSSLHMQAKAIDIRMPGIATRTLRNVAQSLSAGGVGYYSRSSFVHIDSGAVRTWGR